MVTDDREEGVLAHSCWEIEQYTYITGGGWGGPSREIFFDRLVRLTVDPPLVHDGVFLL